MQPLIFLDVETTGFDHKTEKIIEVGLVKWHNKKNIETFQSLVNPGKMVPREITMLTGITQSDVDSAPRFEEIRDTITAFIGDCPVVGHNIPFDTGFLRHEGVTISGSEIDTVELAHILLLKEPSYALEVLMRRYGLTMRESHRALDDTLTTVEFFEFLLKRIEELPPAVLAKLQKYLRTTSWAGACLFEDITARPAAAQAAATTEPPVPTLPQSWAATTAAEALCHDRVLIESPYELPFSELCGKPIVFTCAQQKTQSLIKAAAQLHNVPLQQYKSAQYYLAPKKLAAALTRDLTDSRHVAFLAKMLVWQSQTQTGDRDEISLRREEYSFFSDICDEEGREEYYQQAVTNAQKAQWIIGHPAAIWCNDLEIHELTMGRDMIICDGHMLEDCLSNGTRRKITQSDLVVFFGESGTLVTGLLGIFYEKQKAYMPNANGDDVIVDADAMLTIEWKRLVEAVHNLPEHRLKKQIIEAFTINPDEDIAAVSFFADELSFTKTPLRLGEIFKKGIADAKNVLVHDYSLSGDGTFRLTKELFELDSSWHTIIEKPLEIEPIDRQLLVTIPDDFPEPSTEGYFQECSLLFMKIIKKYKGRSLFIVNSRQAVFAYHSALTAFAREHEVRLLSFGQSGGTGKVLAQFAEDPDHTVVIATSSMLSQIEQVIELSHVVVLNKVAFDPPFNAVFKARGEQFTEGWNEYFLPRCIMRFRHMIVSMGHGKKRQNADSPQRHLCILDSRLRTKKYGKLFVE